MARRLMREEGLLCGGSSGFAMWGALKYIKEHNIGKDKRCVVILPDNIRNYMTKHLNSDWMYERGYITEKECAESYKPTLIEDLDWGQDLKVADLPLHEAVFISNTTTCQEALDRIRSTGFDQFPVKDANGNTVGVLTDKNLLARLSKRQSLPTDTIMRAVSKELRQVSKSTSLNELSRVLTRNSFVLVEDKYFLSLIDVLNMIVPPAVKEVVKEEPVVVVTPKAHEEVKAKKESNAVCNTLWLAAGALIGGVVVGLLR